MNRALFLRITTAALLISPLFAQAQAQTLRCNAETGANAGFTPAPTDRASDAAERLGRFALEEQAGVGERAGALPPDWPAPQAPLREISMRVRAIFVADDDGDRAARVTPEQVALWVDETNRLLQDAGIRLDFDPAPEAGDWVNLNSSLLNALDGTGHPQWDMQRDAANAIAAEFPERMTIFFRWGPHFLPTQSGFSWTDYDFIAMPSFETTIICGDQNIGLLAHEVGHYLGLRHTHTGAFDTAADAAAAYAASNFDDQAFNGDGLDQTQPDPFIWQGSWCFSDTATVAGFVFPLPWGNVMSYYRATHFVESQIGTMRQTLLLRSGQDLTNGLDGEASPVIEAEANAYTHSSGHHGFQQMTLFHGRWSGDAQLIWLDAELGGHLLTTFEAPEEGAYRVYASFTAAPDFGIHQHVINDQAAPVINLYANRVVNTGLVYLGTFELEAGSNAWRVNAVASDQRAIPRNGYGLDYIMIQRACEGDTTGDGRVDSGDLAALLAFWGTPAMDLNEDGVTNASDLAIVLAGWGLCL